MKPHIIYDSALHARICATCGEYIEAGWPKIVYGVGSAQYLRVYHPDCAPKETPDEKTAPAQR